MKIIALFSVMVFVCVFYSCSKDNSPGGVNAGVNNTDTMFMNNVAKGNNGEIMAGQLAATKGNLACVRSFGRFMVTEHSQAQNVLQNVATGVNYKPPAGTAAEDSFLMVQLNSLSGKVFASSQMN